MKSLKLLLLALLIMAVPFATLVACGDDDDDDDSAGDDDTAFDDDDDDDDFDYGDWWPPADDLTMLYEVAEYWGDTFDLEMKIIGDDTYGGDPYTLIQLGDFSAVDIIGFQGWFDFSTQGQIGFIGSEIFWSDPKGAKADTAPNAMFDLTDPAVIYLNPTLDDPMTDTGIGTWTIWDTPSTIDIELTSTTVALDASVTVPYGTVDDCMKVKVEITEEFSEWETVTGTAFFYFHRDMGMIKLEGTIMMMGFYFELKEFPE